MLTADHLTRLRALHEKKRKSGLDGEEGITYSAAVDQLLAAVLAQQEADAGPAGKRRKGVRLRRAIAVDLEWRTGSARAITLDVGLGGFSVLLGEAPPSDQPIVALLHLRRGEPVRSAVRVASVVKRQRIVRASMALIDVPRMDAARLKAYLVEQLVPRTDAARTESSAQWDVRSGLDARRRNAVVSL